MPSLNIPLYTNQRTRLSIRSRRVLWVVLLGLIFCFLVFLTSNLWFNRDSLSAFAPKETLATIHLTPTTKEWNKLITDFGDLSIITDRPLTIGDLANFKPSEAAIFILPEGKTAVALRTLEKNLPQDLLKAYGINLQKLGTNHWLLSSDPIPFSTKGQTKFHISSIWPKTFGYITVDKSVGRITFSENGYFFALHEENTAFALPFLPPETIAAVVLQKDKPVNLTSLLNRFDQLIEPLKLLKSTDLMSEIQKENSLFLIAKSLENPNKIDFLVETELNSGITASLMQTIATIQNPTINPLVLPDNSTAQEILVDPSKIELASEWLDGQEIKSAKIGNDKIFTTQKDNKTLISSNITLLNEYLKNKANKQTVCGSKENLVFINTKEAAGFLNDSDFLSNLVLKQIALKFNSFALNHNGFTICR
ncbi:MAG: hypothetical protein V1664_02520 [Candidatus Uhrbacteria bacterium]